ncbi:MAG: DUF2285 domain-containing protein [Sphingomonadales bacterium]|nr:DUF2285 domain-containing protein [Sphingomonadales bacterium]
MADVNLHNNRHFAWEFLRRNPLYHEHAYCYLSASCSKTHPHNWGLLRFEDPDIPAPKADVFWSERACSSILLASSAEPRSVDPIYSVAPDENTFELSVYSDRNNRLHHLFKTVEGHFQIILLNTKSYMKGNVLLFHLPWFGTFQTHVETIRSFIAAVDKRRSGCSQSVAQKPTIAIRNRQLQLITLDGYLAGKSLREIAESIYSPDIVATEWSDPRQHMKDRLRKIIKRAVLRMNGGYLDFLRPPRDRVDAERYTTNGRNFC